MNKTVNSKQKSVISEERAHRSSLSTFHCTRGYFVILVLVFSAVFLTLISALTGYIFVEKRAQLAKENREKALHVAEAGLDYYRWFLAHFPNDLSGNGTQHVVDDPEGGALGTFELDITGDTFCGQTTTVNISSTGWTAADPTQRRTVFAEYTRPSVAEYSHIVNENVWAGSDREINGLYHSNGGVRMDGENNAPVTSALTTWTCTSSFGCNPDQTVNGVFGGGSGSALWDSPVATIDFGGITVDLAAIEDYAINEGGVYLGDSGDYGYHITFLNNGTFDVRVVEDAALVWGYSVDGSGWSRERRVTTDLGVPVNYPIPPTCPVIFVEDNIWIEGTVEGKAVIAAARIPVTGSNYSVILDDDITYAGTDDGLTVIGQGNVEVGLETPNNMTINGIFIAQNGYFGRDYYTTSGSRDVPSWLNSYVLRDTLTTNGTVVSNGRVGTKWTCGGSYCSGYDDREDNYDANLASDPPPFTPFTSDDYSLHNWQELTN